MRQYWSNQINCKICGFTNRWFPIHKQTIKGKTFLTKLKICVECRNEKTKQAGLKYRRSAKGKARQKRYDAAHVEQRRKMYRVYRRTYVAKIRKAKKLLDLQEKMIGKELR